MANPPDNPCNNMMNPSGSGSVGRTTVATEIPVDYALAYAHIDLKVFPIYRIRDGRCSCGKANCSHPGKHPMTQNGFKDASASEEQIRQWWSKNPNANIAIPTGPENDLVVIDVDKRHNGYDSLVALEEKHGSLPSTWTARTGGDGRHLFFHYPAGHTIKSTGGNPLPGIDIRGAGGYVVVAPSNHRSGGCYSWYAGDNPLEGKALADLPEKWIALLSSPSEDENENSPFVLPDEVNEGQRNNLLFKYGASLRAKGANMRSISRYLHQANNNRCKPPLDPQEVDKIVDGIDKYQRGYSITIGDMRDLSWDPLPCENPKMAFPVSCFPPIFRDYALELADSLQVPLDMTGCAVLGALSISCLGTSVCVVPGYKEPTQLYLAIVAPPSERKSSVLSSVLVPIRELSKFINEMKNAEKASIDLKRKILDKQLSKAIEKGNEEDAKRMRAQKDQLPDVRLFSPPLTDATPEALAKTMSDNGGTLSFASAEGGLINIISGLYAELTNIDVLLQAYSGEPVVVMRIGREPVIIDHATLSILLAVQPQVLERFLANEALLERGLCARFLYSIPQSMLGQRDARLAKSVTADTASRYNGVIGSLAKQSYDNLARELRLTPAALEQYYQWAAEVEKNIGPGGIWYGIANGWEGKLVGNTIRLAGLLKMADTIDPSLPVNEKHFNAAVELAHYFVDHAMAATGKSTGLTPNAREVLSELKKQGLSPFSPYDLRQKLRNRKRFKKCSKTDEALSCLAAAGFIRPTTPPEWQGIGRKPEALYEMHPELLPKKK